MLKNTNKDLEFFISYATTDNEKVEPIFELLENKGYKVFKYDRTSGGGCIWKHIADGIQTSNVFLLFVSWDSEQSVAVRSEWDVAKYKRDKLKKERKQHELEIVETEFYAGKYREINDKNKNFWLIPIYFNSSKHMNWLIDSQSRIDAFKSDKKPKRIVEEIFNLINKTGTKNEPELKISYCLIKRNIGVTVLVIKSERKIILPRIVFRFKKSIKEDYDIDGHLIKDLWEYPIIRGEKHSREVVLLHSLPPMIGKNGVKEIAYGTEYSLDSIKYIGPGTVIEIPLMIDFKKIDDFFLKTIDEKIYPVSIMNDEETKKVIKDLNIKNPTLAQLNDW